jgi:hypothetical protein
VSAGYAAAATLQRQHAPAVLAGRLAIEQRWARPWLAYNVYIRADPAGAAALSAAQEPILALEPELRAMPATAMHVTAEFLLHGAAELDQPKDDVWREHGSRWLAQLSQMTGGMPRFRLRFRHLVATDAAIIAVADEPNRVSELRRAAAAALDLPGRRQVNALVHTTLFRYARPLRDPAGLLRCLAGADARAELDVTELLVARESTFPFFDYDVLRRLALGTVSLAS